MKIRMTALAMLLTFVPVFVSAAEYGGGVQAQVVLKTTVTSNGQKVVYPRTDRAEVTALTVLLPPGAQTGWHSHPTPVYAWVLEGELTVEMAGGKSSVFKAGEAIVEVVDTSHNGRNNGSKNVRLAVFYTGAEGVPTVIRNTGR